MSVRALDSNGDWTFGQGLNNFLSKNAEVVQDINTRLGMFANDCFFSLSGWIDWLNLLGSKNQAGLNLAISAIIIGTDNVTGIQQLSAGLNLATRQFSVNYRVQTSFSTTITNQYVYSLSGTG